jgi:copper homeostasis protein
MALLEVCCGSPESADAAVAGGARRIELCTSLELDGLTPPVAWIRAVKERYPSLVLHVLIRPRAEDFCYSTEEGAWMVSQVKEAVVAGADGIVVGALTPSGDVDVPLVQRLIDAGRGAAARRGSLTAEGRRVSVTTGARRVSVTTGGRSVSVTFHRAFDVCRRPFEALEQIIGLGCDRLLTSGQGATVVEGSDLLRELRHRAAGRLIILPGGGVTPENAARILSLTGCTEIHASASEAVGGQVADGRVVAGRKVTSAAKVAAILRAIEGL